MKQSLRKSSLKVIGESEPGDLTPLALEIHQELGEPRAVVSCVFHRGELGPHQSLRPFGADPSYGVGFMTIK